jgi:5-methylcytosine-specific restriction endonuclease McrA
MSYQTIPRIVLDWWKRHQARYNRCFYCGTDMTFVRNPPFPLTNATRDHIVPLVKGGKNENHNTLRSCLRCNQIKGSMSVLFLREKLHGRWGIFFGEQKYEDRERKSVKPNSARAETEVLA